MTAQYCKNCGQRVSDTPPAAGTAAAATDPNQNFCCACGGPLDANGKCQNPYCKFVGAVPNCT
jgi:hypothetical protein